jgi:hypothetical protein
MPRGLTPSQKATLQQKAYRPAMFVWLDLPSPVYAWDGVGSVTTGGKTWIGVGQMAAVEGIGSERGLRSNGINVGLNGIPASLPTAPDFIKKTRGIDYQGVPLYVYMAMTQHETDVPLSDPWLMWRGVADVMTFQIGSNISVSLSGEHYSSLMRRINGLRMSHESHAARIGSQTDIFFRFLNRLAGRPKKLG